MKMFIIRLLIEIAKHLLPELLKNKSTIENGKPADDCLKRRLNDSIRKAGWILILGVGLLSVGCTTTRTIIIPAGNPVRIRKTIKNAHIWDRDENGKVIPSKMDLHAGWYVLPDPKESQ